jgi:hypothetical protein
MVIQLSDGLGSCTQGQAWWCMPAIITTQETEIKRVVVPGQLHQE